MSTSPYDYKHTQLLNILGDVIRRHINSDAWNWLSEKINAKAQPTAVNTAFAAIPRKTGKSPLEITPGEQELIHNILPGFTIREWPVDRLARVWLLMNLDATEEQNYFRSIENLFLAAEMNELVALYSALPVLAYPKMWVKRCAEGIRSNIGMVLESIMYENPYPAKYLPEPAWNQLILKAFFTEKLIPRISGADERANKELANILSDYAHERWAAHRPVHPQLWRFVAPHLDDHIFADIIKLAASQNETDRAIAGMVCRQSNFPPAKKLLSEKPELQKGISDWNHY